MSPVRKVQRRLDVIDSMVISPTARGLTTGEVEAHLAEVYSTHVARATISKITVRSARPPVTQTIQHDTKLR